MPAEALEQVYAEKLRLNPGAERLIGTAQAAGIKVLLVSGGFTFFTDRLRERLKLDSAHANTLEIDNGVLTGRVLGDILTPTPRPSTCASSRASTTPPRNRPSPWATAPMT